MVIGMDQLVKLGMETTFGCDIIFFVSGFYFRSLIDFL